jgi:ATP-dependent DNA helicase DinG
MAAAATELIEKAFKALSRKPGFTDRPDQRQLALLISDCIDGPSTGAFEAPTGLGKSLAALIPAIAHAIGEGKRTVIATYTNVLAEQYWRSDLPLALGLFGEEPPKAQFLVGRRRYACKVAMSQTSPQVTREFARSAELGIESEFRKYAHRSPKELVQVWQEIAVPVVCPARLCPSYHDCFYYKARRAAERAELVITNHSVVLMDAIMNHASDGALSLLGEYDFLVVDEAHDFPTAAFNALEFELSETRLDVLIGLAVKIEEALLPTVIQTGGAETWRKLCDGFRQGLGKSRQALHVYGLSLRNPGILVATPEEVWNHPQVKRSSTTEGRAQAQLLAEEAAARAKEFVAGIDRLLKNWKHEGELSAGEVSEAQDLLQNYRIVLDEFGKGCQSLFTPEGVSVSYAGLGEQSALLRHDLIDIAGPLRDLVWDRVPWVCLSATLALDGHFGFFKRVTGAEPQFEEILPSPFDFATQAAVYLPPPGAIPDPSVARKEGTEEEYYEAVAARLSEIIRAVGGRTLALFHSRKEMEGVFKYVDVPEDMPIYLQRRTGVASVGEKFVADVKASLFALRSFWTGFDAPGETLSCVALVRVPFEVPVDPPQIARSAWLQAQGIDSFAAHTLPTAKMLMRQGAGRLIRRSTDKGLIALLDPRLITKRYGEQILANLPQEMRTFREVGEAVGWLGLE